MISDDVTIIIMVLTIIKFVENKTRRKLKILFYLFVCLFLCLMMVKMIIEKNKASEKFCFQQ